MRALTVSFDQLKGFKASHASIVESTFGTILLTNSIIQKV